MDKAIDILNEYGILTSPLLMRKLKLTHKNSKNLLKNIVEACENVLFRGENLIYIEGRERDEWLPKKRKIKISIPKIKIKKPSRWKDVTKP